MRQAARLQAPEFRLEKGDVVNRTTPKSDNQQREREWQPNGDGLQPKRERGRTCIFVLPFSEAVTLLLWLEFLWMSPLFFSVRCQLAQAWTSHGPEPVGTRQR